MIKALLKVFYAVPLVMVLFLFNVALSVIPAFILRLFGLKKISDKWVGFNASLTSNLVLSILGGKTVVTGDTQSLEQLISSKAPVCYIANHTSMLDIPAAMGPLGLGMGFIAKKELMWVPVLNLIALSLHSIFIDRQSLKNSARAIRRGIKRIQSGKHMLIFPEGTRSKTGHVNSFKHGSFKLATESGAVIVPLVIKGTRELFENRKKVFENKKVFIKVLSPIETVGLSRDQIFETIEKIEKEVSESYEKL